MDFHTAERQTRLDRPAICVLAGCLALLVFGGMFRNTNSRAHAAEDARQRTGQILRLEGAADAGFYQDLKRTLKSLEQEAEEAGERRYLVLEIHKGPSTYGDIVNVCDVLTSGEYPNISTIAWIPDGAKVTGMNAVIPLACNEIIMHPDAELGDISGGNRDLADRMRSTIRNYIDKARNTKVDEFVGNALLDRNATLYKLIEQKENKIPVPHIVDAKKRAELRKQNLVIPEEFTLKEAGEPGVFTGRKALADGVIVSRTANSLDEIGIDLKRSTAALGERKVALIKVDGVIDPILESFLNRQIDRCEKAGKNLIIFEINSPGGYLSSSIHLSSRIANLDRDRYTTVAYIPEMALSGAAILALACDEIYMAPGAKIGDAMPIEVGPGQQFEKVPEKILTVLRTQMRTLADKKNRPRALLEAMADESMTVYRVTHEHRSPSYMSQKELNEPENKAWVKGGEVEEAKAGRLLTVTGKRAVELGLANAVLTGDDREKQLRNLKSQLGLDPDMVLVAMEPTWVDTFVFWLNTPFVTVLLFVVAIVCIYLELHLMTGMLGIISVLCFALFFWSRFLGGTAGWLEVILFVLGLGCIALEIFVIPGFGVFGITGGLLVLGSLVMASQTFGNLEPNADYRLLARTMVQLAVSIVLVVAVSMALSRYLPHMPLFGQMVLSPPGGHGEAGAPSPQLRPDVLDERAALLGMSGEATSVLRPAGKATIGGRMYDVVSDGPFISEGSEIEVVAVTGNKIVVRAV